MSKYFKLSDSETAINKIPKETIPNYENILDEIRTEAWKYEDFSSEYINDDLFLESSIVKGDYFENI